MNRPMTIIATTASAMRGRKLLNVVSPDCPAVSVVLNAELFVATLKNEVVPRLKNCATITLPRPIIITAITIDMASGPSPPTCPFFIVETTYFF